MKIIRRVAWGCIVVGLVLASETAILAKLADSPSWPIEYSCMVVVAGFLVLTLAGWYKDYWVYGRRAHRLRATRTWRVAKEVFITLAIVIAIPAVITGFGYIGLVINNGWRL